MVSEADLRWFYDYFTDVDTMQIEKMAAWFDEDVIVRFGNEPILHGKKHALEAITALWANFASLSHTHGRVLSNGTYFSDEGTVTFTLLDGRVVSIPGITILERRNGLVTRLSGYLDFAPLYAPADAPITVMQPDFFLASTSAPSGANENAL